jgi:hypothetical protein
MTRRPGGGSAKAGPGLRPLLLDAAAIAVGVVAYFGVRGLTEGSTARAVEHAEEILLLERTIGLDLEVGLQSAVARYQLSSPSRTGSMSGATGRRSSRRCSGWR